MINHDHLADIKPLGKHMALIECKDCGSNISKSATSCPACGAPIKIKQNLGSKLFVVGLALFVAYHFSGAGKTEGNTQATSTIGSALNSSPPENTLKAAEPPKDPGYIKELMRLGELPKDEYCAKELRKLKGKKSPLPQPWFDAIAATAKIQGIDGAHLVNIQEGKVVIGMTDCAAVASWGRPNNVNRTTTANSVREQWVYGGRNYLYFSNGQLTSYQN